MAERNNFLLGNGEKLTTNVDVPSGGGEKRAPYTFQAAVRRLAARVRVVSEAIEALPAEACPDERAVAIMTMHPRYISKSDFPTRLLEAAGLSAIGSRTKRITPEEWGVKNPPESAVTDQIFVSGRREQFAQLANRASRWQDPTLREQWTHIEDFAPFDAEDKIKGVVADSQGDVMLEIGLHLFGIGGVDRFTAYARSLGAEPIVDRLRTFDDLAFLPVKAKASVVRDLARFSIVRVARGMPVLRPISPVLVRTAMRSMIFPDEGSVDPSFQAVIFDGGLPSSPDLSRWVNYIEPSGIGAAVPEYLAHGLAVTGAFLFGPLPASGVAARPYCSVDHVRVLDDQPNTDDLLALDVLERIERHLTANPHYQYINISLGPRMAVDDDDPTPWTLVLDGFLARGKALCCVAAGNDGDKSPGEDRVQPPADGVNVLAVGSANSLSDVWARAIHSCVGPGRSPGVVKPDVVTFGGCNTAGELFGIVTPAGTRGEDAGTSVASPSALRTAAGIRAFVGPTLPPLVVRALLIHHAKPGDHHQHEVGWGRTSTDRLDVITCGDDEVCVVYQGHLPVGEHLRARVPVPAGPLKGIVQIGATLLISPDIDPARPSAYTKAGLDVAFRPAEHVYRTDKKTKKRSAHPVTKAFFTEKNMYGLAEYNFREEGVKWEPTRRHFQTFRPSALNLPVFDIYYHHRDAGGKAATPEPIPYALVITLKAEAMPDLYNRVVRTYSQLLVPLRPQVQIGVTLDAGGLL